MSASDSHVPRNVWTKLYFAYLSLVLVLVTPACFLAFAFYSVFGGRTAGFGKWSRIWSRALLGLGGIRLQVEGRNPKFDSPCVYMANHQNSLDIPAMAIAIDKSFGFVAKASLARIPFLGWALRMSPSVFVDTGDPKVSLASMRRAAQEIHEGSSVVIFPEGQRTWSDSMLAFKKRGFMLAREADVPIVPVAIVDAHLLFDERVRVARPGRMKVLLGDPLMPDEIRMMSLPELVTEVQSRISTLPARILKRGESAPT